MQPQQVLQGRGTSGTRVYSCTCSCGSEEVQAVMQVGECEHEICACVRQSCALLAHSPSRFIENIPAIILSAVIECRSVMVLCCCPTMPLHTGVSDPVSE